MGYFKFFRFVFFTKILFVPEDLWRITPKKADEITKRTLILGIHLRKKAIIMMVDMEKMTLQAKEPISSSSSL